MMFRCLILGFSVATFGSLAMATDPNSLWIKKPVAEALEQAKRENKPALLYWGAVWCPPCNQLKAQVFSHPEFIAATSSFIRIYLDGDEAGAQDWADKLDVSGYPTVLVLAPEKIGHVTKMVERLRIAEFVNFAEFRSLLATALAEHIPLKKMLVAKALRGDAKLEEWKLLAFTWDVTETTVDADEAQIKATIRDLEKLLSVCKFPEVRGLLAARLLNLDTAMHPAWIDAVVSTKEALFAARGPFLAGATQWLEKTPAGSAQEMATRLHGAAKDLRNDPRITPAEKIQSWAAQLDLESYMADHKWIDPKQRDQARRQAVEAALQIEASSKSPYERHAVVSDAAGILASAGNITAAKEMLKREAAASDTPWYYQSTLASLAMQKKQFKEALDWSAKARDSAQGQATKLQWLASDIFMQSKVLREQQEGGTLKIISAEAVATEIRTWLDLAKSVPDGFAGRNALRARKIKDILAGWPETTLKRDVLTNWAETCTLLKGEAVKNCRKILKE